MVRPHKLDVSSSKEIARKAVEEEFKNKKKNRKRGNPNDYGYSSDEDEDGNGDLQQRGQKQSKRHGSKKQQEQEQRQRDKEEIKAIQEDLSSRYRDRAKERREGKLAASSSVSATSTSTTGAAGGTTGSTAATSHDFLIIPHNKKGLDVALARRERMELKNKLHRSDTKGAIKDELEAGTKGSRTMPSLEQAKKILRDFLASGTGIGDGRIGNNNGSNTEISSGISEYVRETYKWMTFDVAAADSWDDDAATEGGLGAAGKSIQSTYYSFEIDGHPSDTDKAWHVPRRYALSSSGGSSRGSGGVALLSSDVVNRIDLVFRSRNKIREEMMKERKGVNCNDNNETVASAVGNNQNDSTNDESDDDIFGDLDD